MNRQESYARLRFVLIGMALIYLCWRLFSVDQTVASDVWGRTHDVISIMFYALLMAMAVFTRPGKGVVADERDAAISALSVRVALIVLSLIVLLSAMIVGARGHAGLLAAHPGGWFEHYLIACLALAWWVESAICAVLHWRDRR